MTDDTAMPVGMVEHDAFVGVASFGAQREQLLLDGIKRGGFAWTCNPYVGCTFGCTYCYAAFLPQNRRPVEDWGKWITAKKNADHSR